ncbi:PREDICTED: xanthine dehydrogenase 1 [Tarenaya hassleriana]|uniref:xanthine dehydrogenase 1 n=1 Tax=Tarenaya hassleriana TaxID=28532 RepID=UPI00053C3391|nr:PREDICTED: xanthine dehydrogenase 1 [Tarenaya hassleriana]
MGSLKNDEETEQIEGKSMEAILYVNGVRRVLPDGLAHMTLLEYLRDVGLTGTKLGCGEGGCGACTVMISNYDRRSKTCLHYAVNACLAPLYSVEGMHVITIEGVGNRKLGLHPVQKSLASLHGSQCGFCTPGFIMSMYALLRSSKNPPSEEEIEECLAGNLCRCTGYRPIIDAFRVFAKTDDALYSGLPSLSLQDGQNICPSTGKPCSCGSKAKNATAICDSNRYRPVSFSDIDGSKYVDKELIFPPELSLRKTAPLKLTGARGLIWYRPVRLQQLLEIKAKYPDAKLLVGNTEVGIEMRLKGLEYWVLISVAQIPELNVLHVDDNGIEIGSAVRLSELLRLFRSVIKERPDHETSACKAFVEQLKWFAGTQIRNVACVGGNICTASPISDLNPLWMSSSAEFRVIDDEKNVRTVLAEDFFIGYRSVDLRRNEILLSVFLPWTRPLEYVKEFKQAHRRDDDIALVNAGMRVFLEEKGQELIVSDASIAYGGVAALSFCARKTKEFLIGKVWNYDLLQDALKVIQNDVLIREDAPGGMVEFRNSLTLSFFFKFFLWVSHQISIVRPAVESIPPSHFSAVQPVSRPSRIGCQDYETVKQGTSVGSSEIHLSAKMQVTGEAEYTDDIPVPPNTLHAALVLSKVPHARILAVDDAAAKASPGFAGLFLAKDVPANNKIGPIVADEELFATDVVTCVGQVIGVVVADTHENAKTAAGKVHVEYEKLPAILSIKEAIDAKSFHPNTEKWLRKGDVELCFESGQCDRIIEGEVQMGGQEHFYLEPHGSLVWTVDGGSEVHMVSSTQAPQKHQQYVSRVLGLPMSKVVCKTKRIGGGFGGKETRSGFVAAVASVPSYLLNRPVKLILDRDVDMMITGHRHSFLGKYKVGFTNEGKVLALDLEIYNNGGNSLDLSLSVVERAMFHSDNVYEIPNMRIVGKVCFTNFPSNTAFRGFGGPQGMLITENWMQRIAAELDKSPEEIQEMNFQVEGSITHYGQRLEYCTLHQLWAELKTSCDFLKVRREVDEFNRDNRWKKRGIAMVPTKFGISFTTKFLNQAGALVHVYTDGTVLVTHGGVEMGQGLHTKVAQIAATAFGIPLSSVYISETSTDKVPNASPTAASASSDMYGAAVLDACEQIKARMEPVASKHNFSSFAELASACHLQRIDLSAHGFHIVPDIGFDWKTGKGTAFRYYTYGSAFAEVEIDTLTGDFHTRTADVILDLGYSLNPSIDVGQIEGAFIQGLGWVALEELKWGDAAHRWIRPGTLFTAGPGNYKIPSVNDIPFKFKVSLLKGHPNVKAIHSSKAVGEPPFFLASAVFFGIKDAIRAARAEVGLKEWFPLDSPATPERIRMACLDDFSSPFVSSGFHPKLSV